MKLGQMNYTKIGNDAEIPPRTIKDYVKILEDTLVAHILPPYKPSKGRKTVSIEKFYFFDIGVANALLAKKHIEKGTPDFGKALEHLVFLEIHAYLHYTRSDKKLHNWRTNSQMEPRGLTGPVYPNPGPLLKESSGAAK